MAPDQAGDSVVPYIEVQFTGTAIYVYNIVVDVDIFHPTYTLSRIHISVYVHTYVFRRKFAIAGAIIGGVVVLVLAFLCACPHRRRRRRAARPLILPTDSEKSSVNFYRSELLSSIEVVLYSHRMTPL